MPIFEYVCESCGHHFEAIVMGSQRGGVSEVQSAELQQQLSKFAAHSKGSASEAPSCASGGPCCMGRGGCDNGFRLSEPCYFEAGTVLIGDDSFCISLIEAEGRHGRCGWFAIRANSRHKKFHGFFVVQPGSPAMLAERYPPSRAPEWWA